MLSESERLNLVNWFYTKLNAIYGSKFRHVFPSDDDLICSKQVWADQICDQGATQLNGRLEYAMKHQNEFPWPDVGAILTAGDKPKTVNAAMYLPHKRERVARSKPELASKYLEEMRKILGGE